MCWLFPIKYKYSWKITIFVIAFKCLGSNWKQLAETIWEMAASGKVSSILRPNSGWSSTTGKIWFYLSQKPTNTDIPSNSFFTVNFIIYHIIRRLVFDAMQGTKEYYFTTMDMVYQNRHVSAYLSEQSLFYYWIIIFFIL